MKTLVFIAALAISAAARAQSCLEPGEWFSAAGGALQPASASQVLSEMAKRDIVLLGEQHDVAADHIWQLQTLAALRILRPRMAIGFEQFPRRAQPVLDAWIAGKLTEKQFLEQTEWRKVWNMPPELYLPLFRFARINRIPMVALNVDRKLIQAVSEKGWESVPDALKEGVSRPAPASEAYVHMLRKIFDEHPRRDGAKFGHFVDSQTTWDRAMAQALARAAASGDEGGPALVVGVIGSGHLRHGYGVRHQLHALGVDSVGTLLPVPADTRCERLAGGIADAIFAVPQVSAEEASPRPRLGVRLGAAKEGVRIVKVLPDSLAQSSGLRDGDTIVSLAGRPVSDIDAVIAAVRGQPPGTWLPLQVRRGERTFELVIKFPPAA